jgi:hypothetical protein
MKSDKIQVRISESDRNLIKRIKAYDPDFNISLFFRKALKEYGDKIVLGIGTLKIV